ncbi:hypothetical protein NBO_4g0060 [Nosema bombycis CQ1]|uniref:Transmembrane protein n=1 Tax=Nosema bombycis (strain CQ1 / CVCC 102059) TaxID=578461 RepID=R0KZ24_NOSB1|nr:hypothetical protein NBO_4g0060 [Nosema bombycis CQ1]|eukprot:EOB15432.1 hypothetical protein NBO_4g0060 [Nosema bombycis CQ1]
MGSKNIEHIVYKQVIEVPTLAIHFCHLGPFLLLILFKLIIFLFSIIHGGCKNSNIGEG